MKKAKKIARGLFPDFPHIITLNKLGIAVTDLNSKLKGRIRLLNKFIESAIINGTLDIELESFYEFSQRVSNEIEKYQFN